ncbi:MAG TPA: FxSxx-COOH system tetratricopeptide repeat protein [Pseudonocardiaceae bacterium]|nr:FxSxx-COOH system tetratricopeptide repeat protein [Pseudonocardiaceae bacterium]
MTADGIWSEKDSIHNEVAGDPEVVVQANTISGGVHVHVASSATRPVGQVVTGRLPHEPPHYQPLPQLDALHALAGSGTAAVVCAVTGRRGVGKTQLAAAYARQRIRDGWPLVAWVSAETTDDMMAGLNELAEAIGMRAPEDDSTVTLVRLRQHLNARDSPGLIVFDNVTDVAAVRDHVPSAGTTQIVVTSTQMAAERLGRRVPVDVFEPDTAIRLLEDITGLNDEAGAREVATELGFLPLALAQAGARIRGAERSYARYLGKLASVPVERYLKRPRDDPYPRGAAEAVVLALDSVNWNEQSDLRRLLGILAVFSPDGVSREVLSDGDDSDILDDALEQLFEASIIEFAGGDGDTITMHRLVQRVIRDRSRAGETFEVVLTEAIDQLGRATFPSDDAWNRRQLGDELVRHAEALWRSANERGDNPGVAEEILALRNWAVEHVLGLRDYARAGALALTVNEDCRRTQGADHPTTYISATNLALTYRLTGNLAASVELYEAVVADSRRVLGLDHPTTLSSTVGLANVYRLSGRHAEAIELHEDTLGRRRGLLGDDDPATLSSANDLGYAYRAMGRYAEAIQLDEDTLARRQRLLGPDHPRTLNSASNLGYAYRAAGRLVDGIELYESTLFARRRVLGPDHPQTLVSASNLAFAYGSDGRLAESVNLHEVTFEQRQRLLGPEHPTTLISASNLARSYALAGRVDEAITLHETTLASRRRLLGPDHPTTLISAGHLAAAYALAGRADNAIALYESTLANRRRLLGPHSPRTLNTASGLAGSYAAAGRLAEAIELYEDTLSARRRVLGDDHPDTASSADGLAAAYGRTGRRAEAIALLKRSLADCVRCFGPDYPLTVAIREHLQEIADATVGPDTP